MRFQAAFEPAGRKVLRAQRRQKLSTLHRLRILESRRHEIRKSEPVVAGVTSAKRKTPHLHPDCVTRSKTRAKVSLCQHVRIRHIQPWRNEVRCGEQRQ